MDNWLIKNAIKTDEIDERKSSNSKQIKRRKVVRKYDPDYLAIGFSWNEDENNPRPQCVICHEILANESMRPSKLRRHIETRHGDLKDCPPEFCKSKLDELKMSKTNLLNFTIINEKSTYASYMISHRIAKTGKPHTIGETLVLPAIKDAVGVMFGEKRLKEVEKIQLSNNTVARRIDEMSQWAENELVQRVAESIFFSLQLDESTDIQNLSQLLVFIRYIWNNETHEDILFCEPIIRGTSDEIFKTLDTYIRSKGLDWMKCVGICTDGARSMCGKKSGVVTKVLEICPTALWTHCSIHREALVSKSLSDDFKNVLNIAVKIVNFIKSRPLQARLFEKLCEEMGSNHKSLLMHTEVRWLSRGKVLTRLVELREEVSMFISDKNKLVKFLQDMDFILKLTYLADIFTKLNELNIYLQGTESTDIFAVHDKIRGFIKKLVLWKINIENRRFHNFETFENFIIENNLTVCNKTFIEISKHLSTLKENFDDYFNEEFETSREKNWIAHPFQDNITTGISPKADEELIDLSENTSLKLIFNRSKLSQFWITVQQTYPILAVEALKLLIPFTSTYLCEVGFSEMVGIKTKFRNKLKLSNNLRLKISRVKLDFSDVIKKNRKQFHPSHAPHS